MAEINGYSKALAEDLQNIVFQNGTSPGQANLYCALFNTVPQVDGTGGIEPTGNAYARVEMEVITIFKPAVTTLDTTTSENDLAITFPKATPAGWGDIDGFGIFTALTGGVLLVGGPIAGAPKTIATDTIAVFLEENLKINTQNQ